MYSTVAQLRANVPSLASKNINDNDVEDRITLADSYIDVWRGTLGYTSSVPEPIPTVINLISQMWTAELVLRRFYLGMEKMPEDFAYYKEQRELLQNQVESGMAIKDSGGVVLFQYTAADYSNSLPDDTYFGYGRYGQA